MSRVKLLCMGCFFFFWHSIINGWNNHEWTRPIYCFFIWNMFIVFIHIINFIVLISKRRKIVVFVKRQEFAYNQFLLIFLRLVCFVKSLTSSLLNSNKVSEEITLPMSNSKPSAVQKRHNGIVTENGNNFLLRYFRSIACNLLWIFWSISWSSAIKPLLLRK